MFIVINVFHVHAVRLRARSFSSTVISRCFNCRMYGVALIDSIVSLLSYVINAQMLDAPQIRPLALHDNEESSSSYIHPPSKKTVNVDRQIILGAAAVSHVGWQSCSRLSAASALFAMCPEQTSDPIPS